jgi:putative methionine-R-sulfoxide reductase with GAF domain
VNSSTPDIDNALQLIARRAQTLTLASGAAIALNWPDQPRSYADEMICRASAGEDAPSVGACLRVGSGFSGECVREGKFLRCDDSETDARVDRDNCRNLGIRSMVAVPVKDSETVVGILEVFSPNFKAFTESDINELQGLAEQVASLVKISHARDTEPENDIPLEHLPFVLTPPDSDLFGSEIFISYPVPWNRFLQSAAWHLVALLAIWNLSQGWAKSEQILRRASARNSSITYYKPSFPTSGSHRPRLRAPSNMRNQSATRAAIQVRAPRPQPTIVPPSVKLAMGGQLKFASWKPVIPRAPVPAAPVLGAPIPSRQLASAGRPNLVQASVVAPPPQVAAVLGRSSVSAPHFGVAAPAPTISSIRSGGAVPFGRPGVVGPPPGMPQREQTRRLAVSMGAADGVIAPPPGMPLHESAGALSASLGAPPVIGPPPGIPLHEKPAGAAPTLGGNGNLVVPPAPSLSGGTAFDRGQVSSLSGIRSPIAAPAPSIAGSDAMVGSAKRAAMSIPPTRSPLPPPEQAIEDPAGRGPQELPIRLIGLALALPSSSYFSNYEVYIAERRVGKDKSQLIKLVYESRPYQKRVSEYGMNETRIYKLRMTRDAACDEVASQVVGTQHSEMQGSSTRPSLTSIDRNSMLPCYRTTVDDYRKALARAH